jgi:hypothetical protein
MRCVWQGAAHPGLLVLAEVTEMNQAWGTTNWLIRALMQGRERPFEVKIKWVASVSITSLLQFIG